MRTCFFLGQPHYRLSCCGKDMSQCGFSVVVRHGMSLWKKRTIAKDFVLALLSPPFSFYMSVFPLKSFAESHTSTFAHSVHAVAFKSAGFSTPAHHSRIKPTQLHTTHLLNFRTQHNPITTLTTLIAWLILCVMCKTLKHGTKLGPCPPPYHPLPDLLPNPGPNPNPNSHPVPNVTPTLHPCL